MNPLIADASVVCKLYFTDEGDAALADKALFAPPRPALMAPELLLVEVGNSVFRRVRDGEMSRAEGDLAMRDMQRRFPRLFPVAPLMDAAWNMAIAMRHPVSDCVYLALAVRRRGLLVTADQKFLARVKESRWSELAMHLRDIA